MHGDRTKRNYPWYKNADFEIKEIQPHDPSSQLSVFSYQQPSQRERGSKPTQLKVKNKLTITVKEEGEDRRRIMKEKVKQNNLEEIIDKVQLNISEKNSEKVRTKQKEEEKYEKDIKALKKRLDFITNSN